MKYNYTYACKSGNLTETEVKYFERVNPGFKCTGEELEEQYEEEQGRESGGTTFVVMKATKSNWTPYGMCRDCGDHYIIARWSRYDKIDKETLEITRDVEDR